MNLNDELIQKLDLLVRLTAANVVQGKEFREQIRLLTSVGLPPKDIANILGKTPNNVSVTINKLKKKRE